MILQLRLTNDIVNEPAYLASLCELGTYGPPPPSHFHHATSLPAGYELGCTPAGWNLSILGFNDKLLVLTEEILVVMMSFRTGLVSKHFSPHVFVSASSVFGVFVCVLAARLEHQQTAPGPNHAVSVYTYCLGVVHLVDEPNSANILLL